MAHPLKNRQELSSLEVAGQLLKSGDYLSFFRRLYFYFFGRNLKLSQTLKPNLRDYVPKFNAPTAKPKIIFIFPNLNIEGAPLSGFELAQEFASSGEFAVKIMSPFDGPLQKRIANANIEVEIIGDKWPNFANFQNYELEIKSLAQFLAGQNAHILFGVSIDAFAALDAGCLLQLPMIWNIRESGDWREVLADRNPKIAARALAVFDYCQSIIFVAQSSINSWGRFIDQKDKISLIRNPINIALNKEENDQSTRNFKENAHEYLIANIGTICERKGQIDLIMAASQIQKAIGRPLRIVFAGKKERAYFEKISNKIVQNSDLKIEFCGVIEDISSLYKQADLVINCARTEAFPRVLLEAAANEVPIIATDVDGVPELFRHNENALLYKPGEWQDLASLGANLANNPDFGKAIAQNAKHDLGNNGNITQVGKKYCDIALKILGEA